jgi:hypothetical protein
MWKLIAFGLMTFVLPFSQAYADDLFSGGDAAGMKKCAAISTLESHYTYGEGELIGVVDIPTPEAIPKRKYPRFYLADFRLMTDETGTVRIRGHWADLSVPEYMLKLAPLPIRMEPGKRYGFCYQQRAPEGGSNT